MKREGIKSPLMLLPLLFITMDVSAMVIKDCPPVSFYDGIVFSTAGGWNWFKKDDTSLKVSEFETDSVNVSSISNKGTWKLGIGAYIFEDLSQVYFRNILLELNVYHVSATLDGEVWQFQLPEFYNYNFEAPISSTRLMLDLKPSLISWQRFSFYPILGLGVTWNKASYNETVVSPDVSPTSAYSLDSNTDTDFAWEVGAGLRFGITNNINATAEYIYASLGSGTPDSAENGVRLSDSPNFSFRTQSILLGVAITL